MDQNLYVWAAGETEMDCNTNPFHVKRRCLHFKY
jgi:hypothetical protein